MTHHKELYETMLARARRREKGLAPLSEAEITYWALRFRQLHIRFWTGCTFDDYLKDPLLWEASRKLALHRAGLGRRRKIFSPRMGAWVVLPHRFN